MIKKPTKIRFINPDIKEAYLKLRVGTSDEKKLYKWISNAFDDLKNNGFCGVAIPKDRIPKRYKQLFGKHSIWKYDLPSAYRLIYTIEDDEIEVYSIVLEWMTHKEYERLFKY